MIEIKLAEKTEILIDGYTGLPKEVKLNGVRSVDELTKYQDQYQKDQEAKKLELEAIKTQNQKDNENI